MFFNTIRLIVFMKSNSEGVLKSCQPDQETLKKGKKS